MTTWLWFGWLLSTHGTRAWKTRGNDIQIALGIGVWKRYGPWPITYAGYMPWAQL